MRELYEYVKNVFIAESIGRYVRFAGPNQVIQTQTTQAARAQAAAVFVQKAIMTSICYFCYCICSWFVYSLLLISSIILFTAYFPVLVVDFYFYWVNKTGYRYLGPRSTTAYNAMTKGTRNGADIIDVQQQQKITTMYNTLSYV